MGRFHWKPFQQPHSRGFYFLPFQPCKINFKKLHRFEENLKYSKLYLWIIYLQLFSLCSKSLYRRDRYKITFLTSFSLLLSLLRCFIPMSPTHRARKYWMIIRGPGFLEVVWFGSSPSPSASCLSFSVFLCVAGRVYWQQRGEGEGKEPNHMTARKPGPLQMSQYSLSRAMGDAWWVQDFNYSMYCSPDIHSLIIFTGLNNIKVM
jgi:hypothetical protein